MAFFTLIFSIFAHFATALGVLTFLLNLYSVWVELTISPERKRLCIALGKDYGGLHNLCPKKLVRNLLMLIIGSSYLLTEVYQVIK